MRPVDIVILLDRSGSMSAIKYDAIGGYNQFIQEQRGVDGDAMVTLVQFCSITPHEIRLDRVDLKDVPELTNLSFRPSGSTPLYDAMVWTIRRMGRVYSDLPEDEKPSSVVFVILTDGKENSSMEHTRESVFRMVEQQQNEWGWKFVYLGANQDAISEATSMGIALDPNLANAATYAATGAGIRGAYGTASVYTASVRTGEA